MPSYETLGRTIDYEVIWSENATKPRIDIDIHGVRVVLPEGDDADPETFLAEHVEWVLDKRRIYEGYREEAPERTFEEGAEFPYLGEDRVVKITDRNTHELSDNAFLLASEKLAGSTIKTELEKLYRAEARAYFERRCTYYRKQMDVSYKRIEIRNQRTRWASCSPKDILSFNWRLVMAPPEVVDYIVVHELAHLKERKHTNRFWNIVSEYVPKYRKHAQWLTEHSPELIFTEDDL